MREVFEFLNDLAEAETEALLLRVLERHLEQLGIGPFAYLSQCRDPATYRQNGTFPAAWCQRYRDMGYLAEDAVVQMARRVSLPFRWRPLLNDPKITPPQRRIFEEAAEHGLHDGLAIPLHGAGLDFGVMLLAAPGQGYPRSMESSKHLIHLMALHFHAAVEECQRPDPQSPPIELSPRETECLRWISKGKTAWEISQILRISERTAIYHIENAKRKLGVTTRNHAVVKAVTLGLITP